MKKGFVVVGFLWVLFFSACASTGNSAGEGYGPGVAHLPRHFTRERMIYPSGIRITGLRGEFTSVIIPSMIGNRPVIEIGSGAFRGKNLTEVTISDGVNLIGERAFENNAITEVTIPGSVTIIRENAFANNSITQITFSGTINKIENRAFADNMLTSIALPAFIQAWDSRRNTYYSRLVVDAFEGNPLNGPIDIPRSLDRLGVSAALYIIIDGKIDYSNEEQTITLLAYNAVQRTIIQRITIPSYINEIPVTAIAVDFHAGTAQSRITLNELILPENLLYIEPGAFAFCNVRNVDAPNEAVLALWQEYYPLQQELDAIGDIRARNEASQRMLDHMENLRQGMSR